MAFIFIVVLRTLKRLTPKEAAAIKGLIDQQSAGKRSLYLMDTVNAKKR
jgi:hypothetical protein